MYIFLLLLTFYINKRHNQTEYRGSLKTTTSTLEVITVWRYINSIITLRAS